MYIQVHDINSRSIENKVSVVMNYVVGMGLKHDRYFVSIFIGYMRPGSCNQRFLRDMRLLITTYTRVHISSRGTGWPQNNGALYGGSKCCMLILRNANVACLCCLIFPLPLVKTKK